MKRDLTESEEKRAFSLVCAYYAEQLAQAVRGARQAQDKVLEATERMRDFAATSEITAERDELRVALWAGTRASEQPVEDGAGASRTDDRRIILRWLRDGGYDLGPVFEMELDVLEADERTEGSAPSA